MNDASPVTKYASLKPLGLEKNTKNRPLNLRMSVHLHSRNPESTQGLQMSEVQSQVTSLESLGWGRLEEFPGLNPTLESLQARYSPHLGLQVSNNREGTNPGSTSNPQNESYSGPPPSVLLHEQAVTAVQERVELLSKKPLENREPRRQFGELEEGG